MIRDGDPANAVWTYVTHHAPALADALRACPEPVIVLGDENWDEEVIDALRPDGPVRWAFVKFPYLFVGPFQSGTDTACPLCVLFFLANEESTVAAVRTTSDEALPETPASPAAGLGPVSPRPGSVVAWDLSSGETLTFRCVHPHPACAHRILDAPADHPDVTINFDVLMDELSDPVAGLCQRLVNVREFVPDTVRGRMGGFEVFGAAFANPAFPTFPSIAYHDWAYGSGRSVEDARQRALFECVERFCVMSPPVGSPAFVGRYAAAPGVALDPMTFWQYAAWQHDADGVPLRHVTNEDEVSWFAGESADGEQVLVPGPYGYVNLPPDQMIGELTTSGTAVHTGPVEARLRALLEAIERDATMRHWCRGELVTHIDPDSLPPGARSGVDDLVAQGYDVRLLDATTTAPASVVIAAAAARLPGVGPARVVCSAADLGPEGAVERAVRELAAALVLAWAFTERDGPALMRADQVVDPEDHARYYRHPDNSEVLDFFFAPAATASIREVRKSEPAGDCASGLSTLTGALAKQAMTTVFLDLGSAYTRHRGLHVVRTVVPQLFPLTFGTNYLRLGGPGGAGYPVASHACEFPHPYS